MDIVHIPFKDKIAHFSFYFIMYYLWEKALDIKGNKKYIKLILIIVLYGIIIEVFQAIFTSDRHADFYDVLANTLGAFVAYVFSKFVSK